MSALNKEQRYAALLAAAKAKAGTSAGEKDVVKSPTFLPVIGVIEKDLWKDSLGGLPVIHRFQFKDGKLLGTHQQLTTETRHLEATGQTHRYVNVLILNEWMAGKPGKLKKEQKLRNHRVRLARVDVNNPDFLEGATRDFQKKTVKEGTEVWQYSGAVNRVSWEYLSKPVQVWIEPIGKPSDEEYVPGDYRTEFQRTGEVEISFQRLEEITIKDRQAFFVVSPYIQVITDKNGDPETKVGYRKLPRYKQEGSDVQFFECKEDLENWEAWYQSGGPVGIEWDVYDYEVLWAEQYDDWTDVRGCWETIYIAHNTDVEEVVLE